MNLAVFRLSIRFDSASLRLCKRHKTYAPLPAVPRKLQSQELALGEWIRAINICQSNEFQGSVVAALPAKLAIIAFTQ